MRSVSIISHLTISAGHALCSAMLRAENYSRSNSF